MKQTLGKIFLILLFLSSVAFAGVKVTVNPPAVYKGDMVQLTITAEGDDIEFPQIAQVGDSPVMGTSSSQSVNIINGKMSKTISKTYSFRATKSLKVPSFVVKVDGKEFKTKEQSVTVVKPTASHAGQPFVLDMSLDKNVSYVGEPINLTLNFKSKLNAHADKIQLGEPKLDNFWVKKSDKVSKTTEGDYIVQSLHYKLFPQKAGEYTVPPIEAMIGRVQRQRGGFGGGIFDDPFFNSMTQQLNWQKIYSNNLKVKVNPLPNGLELYGDYSIKATVEKHKVYANKPVNLTVTVQGVGNIDDVKKFDLDIANVIVYADEPKIRSGEQNGVYGGVFTQKIALIADQNFTIPSLSLDYFDKKSKSVKTVKTKPIDIEVVGGGAGVKAQPSIEVSPSQKIEAQKVAPPIKTKVITKTEDSYLKYLFLGIGFLLGVGSMLLVNMFKNSKEAKKETDMVKAIRRAKNDQSLFNLLLPYSKKDKRISKALNLLEENLYKGSDNKIDKEELMEVFEEE